MRESKQRLSAAWLAQSVQMLCFVAILLVICGVLMRVYSGVAKESQAAKDLNNAVQLCRSAEEAFYGTDSLDEAVQALGGAEGERQLFFDEQLDCTEDGSYLMILEESEEGRIRTCSISVYVGADLIYSLSPERYQPEVES
jgi:hypothetical protein